MKIKTITPRKLIYLNDNSKILDYCEPYYPNPTFTEIPKDMGKYLRTVEVEEVPIEIDNNNKEQTDTLVIDYKIISKNDNVLNEIEETCDNLALELSLLNGPIRTYANTVGDALDLTFFLTYTEESRTFDSVDKLHKCIKNISPEEVDLILDITAFCPEHVNGLCDITITTNLFKAISFQDDLLSESIAVFFPDNKGKLNFEDYTALAILIGKNINSPYEIKVAIDESVDIDYQLLIETYCRLNRGKKNEFLIHQIRERLIQGSSIFNL